MLHFENSPKIQQLKEALKAGHSIVIEELWDSPKALIAALAHEATGKKILLLTAANREEVTLYQDFPLFTDAMVLDYPAWETLPNEKVPPSPDIVGDRYEVLHQLKQAGSAPIIVTGLQACLQKLIPEELFKRLYLTLKVGETYDVEFLTEELKEMGYRRVPVASDKGEYAVRGGLVDVFPVSSPDPFRIEFWGDEIESVRLYDPVGQKSSRKIQEANIPPATEMELVQNSETLSTILDYLGQETLVIFDDLLGLEDRYASLTNLCGQPTRTFASLKEFLDQLMPLQKIFLTQQPLEELSNVSRGRISEGLQEVNFQILDRRFEAQRWASPFLTLQQFLEPEVPESDQGDGFYLLNKLGALTSAEGTLTLIYNTDTEQHAIKKKLDDFGVRIRIPHSYTQGYLTSGFAIGDTQEIILPYTELTHRYKIRRQKQRSTIHSTPSEAFELNPGDMVVHETNGIGKFLGIERRPNHTGVESEFFLIEYSENARLFVPFNQAHLITKYIGAHEEAPKLSSLRNTRWKKAKEKTEQAILGYAHDLLELYAHREMAGGYSYRPDSADLNEFEQDFPYIETEDQLNAIRSLKEDMTSAKSMDRLVCGDVGYGKTEVAMRAAFKAVVDGGKQVAVLVPTTVLAMQHYENFVERMLNFPINVGVLSRFRTPKQTRETLEGLAKGSIDIIIGTHRLVSKDIVFKDLGLVIIDEEQRFGVKTKEHLKKIKAGVDCLTLSATPIPRTLYMSLVGARDLSIINTPPQDRLPIKTIIAEPHDEILKTALQRELARDGQAYVVHNRVESIFDVAARIKKLVPQARVIVGHGQMPADEIDAVFHAFKNGEADILVATSIIENGIDIPNANTILIDRADMFGLADLYQLRGRVGRWNRRAYAYFLVPNHQRMSPITRKRLMALAEASGYGGGMKLAMRDLEIRGAGDILGTEQSGHVIAVGFHLYCKLLKRTIKRLQGKMPHVLIETKMEFPFDARLSESFVNETSLRLEFYQRLGEAISVEDVDEIWEELLDRFGAPPESAQWLYHLSRLRVFAALHGFSLLKLEKVSLIAKREKGKVSGTKQILFKTVDTPKDFEEKVIAKLKETFALED